MKWFLITLAIGLAASDTLDRTYLPPPGAQLSGGILGSHDAPLEPPHHTHSGQGPSIGGHDVSHPTFGINGEPVNFGNKIPKVPVTTTSYAFSQTTTYPPGEGFETTALPINPVTGLPIQFGQGNFPNGPFQDQGLNFGTNTQPGFDPQGPTAAPENNGSPGYNQFPNQPLNQYPGQNVIRPAGTTLQTPGLVYPGQNKGQLQYPGGQNNAEQQVLVPVSVSDNQRLDQYPGQNVVNPGGVVQIPGGNQGLVQYPGGQRVTGQQGIVPSTGSPISLKPGENQYGVDYDGSQGQLPQGTYTGQPINVPNLAETQPTQISFQNRAPINVGGSPSQYPNGNQNYGPAVATGSENVYRPGSTPSTIPSSYNNGVSSTTPLSGVPSSTSSYPSIGPVYRAERPQAAADRNAVILNYENVRTPNGYSYSFDTSNGIHADENGIVDNGTKAQGSYSYIGDDGKVYSVIYTADENGFQPRGDHLPTPPPIPEAIQRVIEQAARDKAAGIVHDGSYDEEKYGDHKYQGIANHRRPQNQDSNQFENDQFNRAKDDLIKPIVGIKDFEYDEGVEQNQFNNNLPVTGTTKDKNEKLPARRPSNQINDKNNGQDIPEGNRRVSEDFDSPKGTFDGNSMPLVEEGINQQSNFGTKKQGSLDGRDSPVSIGNNVSLNEANDSNENNLTGSKRRGPSSRRPISSGVKSATEKYPGFNVDVGDAIYTENKGDEFDNSGQNVDSGNSNIDGAVENMKTNFDIVTGAPIAGNKKQMLRNRIKGNRRPDTTGNKYTQNRNGRPQDETSIQEITETAPFIDYINNSIADQQLTQHDDKGYHYQQPNKKFEQNTFPTRFSPQEVFSTRKPDQRRTEYVEGTTRPFMTPSVYDKNDRSSQSTPSGYNQNNRNIQSTTRRPFTTVGVTSPMDNSYTEYDDGQDYTTGDDRIDSNRYPAEKGDETSRPYQPSQTTSKSQNVPSVQRTRVNQKGTVIPGRRTENSGTVSPGFTYEPTTQITYHNSRFGSTEIPRRMKPQQRGPSDTVPNSKTAVGSPVTTQSSSGTRPTDYNYQTTGPKSKYPGTNVGSGYPTTDSYSDFGSMSTTPGVSIPQDYYTSTYGPTHGYPSTTAAPSTYGNRQDPSSPVSSSTPGSFQPTQEQSLETGYHYEPPKSGSINLDGPGFYTPTGTSGVFPSSPTGTYQTTYQQGPGGFPSTTLSPVTPGRQGTYITSEPGTAAPETLPTGTYQENYQNGPSTPNYGTSIVSSTPAGKPIFKYPGSPGAQATTGYEYGPIQTTYSTTNSPSTIGTTPGSFIPSGTTDPSQGYSTTYRPGFQTTKDTFVGGPVDGFGRPIITEQGGSHPGFGHTTQGPTGLVNNLVPNFGSTDQSTTYPAGYDQPRTEQGGSHPGLSQPTHGNTGLVNNLGPNFERTDQSTTYPGSYDQTRVIGEDFSGPKQPQRYDPKTGYHYK